MQNICTRNYSLNQKTKTSFVIIFQVTLKSDNVERTMKRDNNSPPINSCKMICNEWKSRELKIILRKNSSIRLNLSSYQNTNGNTVCQYNFFC